MGFRVIPADDLEWETRPAEPGEARRHAGTLTMYLGEPPERHEVGPGGVTHVEPETALQVVNESDDELLVYIHGAPPERGHAEFLESPV